MEDTTNADGEYDGVQPTHTPGVKFTKAVCKRASRAACPSAPSREACSLAASTTRQLKTALESEGRHLIDGSSCVRPVQKADHNRNPMFRPKHSQWQAKLSHIAQLKGKAVSYNNRNASFLNAHSPQRYERLLESAIAANAVNSSVTKLRETQGASLQTTRISCDGVGRAAACQVVHVGVVMAIAEGLLRCVDGVDVRNPIATNAIDPCLANHVSSPRADAAPDATVCIVSTAALIYNVNPSKLCPTAIQSAARKLAHMELAHEEISVRVASGSSMLTALCSAIHGKFEIDSNWASFVLIVYLSCDPRGRPLLAEVGLTDLDLQAACVFEAYGRSEIIKRARLRLNQQKHAPSVQVLAAKRKRASSSSSSASATDTTALLQWWVEALRCADKSVLDTLVTASRSNANDAALATLSGQLDGIGMSADGVAELQSDQLTQSDSWTVRTMAQNNANQSASALIREFVRPDEHESPQWLTLRIRDRIVGASCERAADLSSAHRAVLCLARSPHTTRSAVLHACRSPPSTLRPTAASGVGLLWSVAAQELCVRSESASAYAAPGLLERHGLVAFLRSDLCRLSSARKAAAIGQVTSLIAGDSRAPLPSVAAGKTRSVISLTTSIAVHEHTLRCAEEVRRKGLVLHREIAQRVGQESDSLACPCEVIGTTSLSDGGYEPLCLPAHRLAIGIRLNELLRQYMIGRTRKGDPCRVLLCEPEHADTDAQPQIMDAEPVPLATITTFDVRVDADEIARALTPPDERDAHLRHVQAAKVALHVCLDSATRAVEMIAACKDDVWKQRALIFVASSQASYVGDVGAALSAQKVCEHISSSKKILCPDVNTVALLSIWDVYGGGLTNVYPSFGGTAYSGTYGPSLDTGITCPGLQGHNYRSDKRFHSSMMLNTNVADQLALKLAHSRYVRVGEDGFVATPTQTCGVPHGFVAGVHSLLDDYVAALNHVAAVDGSAETSSVKGLFSLPFGAFTQSLRPDVESTADSTLRHSFRTPADGSCATGRCYLPDATAEHEAILTEPLFRRPCQASMGDNPFATSYEHVDSLFNAMNALAVIASCCGGVDALHRLICTWHADGSDSEVEEANAMQEGAWRGSSSGVHWQWAADACVLIFGVVYPADHRIAHNVVPECYALACTANAKAARTHRCRGRRIHELVDATRAQEARAMWDRFCTRSAECCPWRAALRPFLLLVLRKGGSHDTSLADIAAFRAAIAAVCSSGAWLAYSPDGARPPPHPNPAAGCATKDHVRRPTLDPVFVARGTGDARVEPRGCLVGLKPFQLRQVYALLLGAHLDDAVVQVTRNEGGLLLRVSSCSTILTADGKPRSAKSISPTSTEGDSAAFGERADKEYGANLQEKAWNANALLLAPLMCAISAPLPHSQRTRGTYGEADAFKMEIERSEKNTLLKHTAEAFATRQLQGAATSETTAALLGLLSSY